MLEDDEIERCPGCGRTEYDSGQCVLCCPNGGAYAPGTEECNWCPDSDVCERDYVRRHSLKQKAEAR